MVMETIQIRLTKKLVEEIDELVNEGYYPNRSEAVRDAVRRMIMDTEEFEDVEDGDTDGPTEIPEHVRELRKYTH
ncbi:MAG: ribbon-helix-helix domain-containing protein [Candidatus Woesearchaeota archaeon]